MALRTTGPSRLLRAAALSAALPVLIGAAPRLDPPLAADPAFHARAAQNRADAEGRGRDQSSNPDFIARFMPRFAKFMDDYADGVAEPETVAMIQTDPYRDLAVWAPEERRRYRTGHRGSVRPVEFQNRYGATLRGHLWWPRTGAGPFPAVVIVNGFGNPEQHYWWAAQGLAENGYVALTFDPQGQGRSDTDPDPRYCQPNGAWKRPQEMGIREHGPCAGVRGEELQEPDPLALITAREMTPDDMRALSEEFAKFRSNFVFGAIDATDWLLGPRNPRHGLIDRRRVGIAGHSAGADAALQTANGEPKRRFRAAVTWDGNAYLLDRVEPTVPTLFQQAEHENIFGPRLAPPTEVWWSNSNAETFAAAGLPTGLITPRASTHQEWTWIPYGFMPGFYNPPLFNASSHGQVLAFHYTLAWFDRHLKGDAAATERLTVVGGTRFDGLAAFADAASIGQGSIDPTTGGNAPYRIARSTPCDRLSFYYPSFIHTPGAARRHLTAGC